MKLVKETRKIWNCQEVQVTATCIRVPVMRAHAESVNLQFENPLDEVIITLQCSSTLCLFSCTIQFLSCYHSNC